MTNNASLLSLGNDLARILRWGPGYSGEDPHHILVSVDEADVVLMDRWTILLDAQDMSEDGKDSGFLEPPKVCFNQSKKFSPLIPLKVITCVFVSLFISDCADEQLLWSWH